MFHTIDDVDIYTRLYIVFGDTVDLYAQVDKCQALAFYAFEKWNDNIDSFSEYPSCLSEKHYDSHGIWSDDLDRQKQQKKHNYS
jgi:hypothetical protein